MSNTSKKTIPDENYFFTDLINVKVINRNKKIGRLKDLIIVETNTVPHVKSFYISRPFGDPTLIIPMENVVSLSKNEIIVDIESTDQYEGSPGEDSMLLRDYVMDKKVIDTEEHEVSVVNDIRIALINKKAYVWDVDFSVYGYFRRMGLKWLAEILNIKDDFISWSYIQPLPIHISSFKGDIKLKTLKEKLSEIPPVDMADILEELDREQRTEIFNALEPEHASDTLEELQPSVQREMISTLNKETVITLINEMTPAQAADLLSVISYSERKEILAKVDPEMKEKIQAIIEQQDENILNFTTESFLKYSPEDTVASIKENYYNVAKDKKIIMYIYVVDETNTLKGVFDIKELLQAEDNQIIKYVMNESIIDLKPDSTLKEAATMFARYGFRAIPVTDENNTILGVIPYKDIMNLRHRFF
jgi:magnesium transporter